MNELYNVVDIVEWFTAKENMPEFTIMNDELVEDFENYSIKNKGCDRFITYFYGLLPKHDKELYDKYYNKLFDINSERQKRFKEFTREIDQTKEYEMSEEDYIFDPDKIIRDNSNKDYDFSATPQGEIVASYLDTAYVLRKFLKNKQVYSIHPTLADSLAETNISGFYPNILDNLPFKTFYIDMTNIEYYYNESLFLGVFVNIIKDTNAVDETGNSVTQYLMHMVFITSPHSFCWCRFVYYGDQGKVSLKDGFSRGSVIEDMGDWIPSFIVNTVAYIASNNAEMAVISRPHKHNRKQRFNPRKALLENTITNWNVGYVIGPKIEKALKDYESEEIGTHASPRPHIRGGHWHHYWTGPKSGEQTLIVHWINETLVNCDSIEEVAITERRSKKQKEKEG